MKEQVSRRWRNWCQNEVYEETKEAARSQHNNLARTTDRKTACRLQRLVVYAAGGL